MNTRRIPSATIVVALLAAPAALHAQTPVGTAFTYQGQLKESGQPLAGTANFEFTLWDAETGGTQVAGPVILNSMPVNEGLFTVLLDFGADVFTGDARWLEVVVDGTTLSPRQLLTTTPYALYALNGGGNSPWGIVGSDIYYDGGNVGVGTSSPVHPLHVRSSSASTVICGEATATSGFSQGVLGEIQSPYGVGVSGESQAYSGTASGVQGGSQSPDGVGVLGYNDAEEGNAIGVRGVSASPTGFGGYFEGRGYFSSNVGIGEPNPQAKLHIGGTPDVDGIMFPDGTLQKTAASGSGSLWTPVGSDIYYDAGNVGVGSSSAAYPLDVRSGGATTLHAQNTASGAAVNASSNGTTIIANSNTSSGNAKAVFATAFSPEGFAVCGRNEGEVGDSCGVYGESVSVDGIAIYGHVPCLQASGSPIAIYGKMDEYGGRAVYGEASTGGVNYAIRGHTNSSNGYAGYFTGGLNYFEGNVGLGTSAPQSRLHLVGPDDPLNGPLFTLEADTADSVESGRIRFGENTGDMRGAFIHYDGSANDLNLGTHPSADSDPANDINAITIDRATGNVGIHREAIAWPLHVGEDAYFEERVGIGALTYGAKLCVGGDTQLDGHVNIDTDLAMGKLDVETDSDDSAINASNRMAGGVGVYGYSTGYSGETCGVEGSAFFSPDGIGVKGTGYAIGVRGEAVGTEGFAGYFDGRGYFGGRLGIGTTDPTAKLHIGGDPGVDGIRFPDDTLLTTAYPIWQKSGGNTYFTTGRVGIGVTSPMAKLQVVGSPSFDEAVIDGETHSDSEDAVGVRGTVVVEGELSSAVGVHGRCVDGTGLISGHGTAVLAEGGWNGVVASGSNTGVRAFCTDGYAAMYAFASGTTTNGIYARNLDPYYAGYFSGNVDVSGHFDKTSGSFKIDHPLDPENKYLYHSFVESPDMMNIYNGNVVTDERGYATIEMPEWFEPLNRDFRYQLTVVDEADSDAFVLAKVVRKIADNCFTIRTSAPNVEVSWQVTGIRQDEWANAHRIQVEVDKPDDERGYYIHPKLYGKTIEESIEWQKLPPREQEEIRERLAADAER